MKNLILVFVSLTSLSVIPRKVTSSQVSGLVNEVINVTLVLDDVASNVSGSLLCEASVHFIKFIEESSEHESLLVPLTAGGRENVSLQIRSNIIGIFSLKFSSDNKAVLADRQIEVVIGRTKVEENILVNVAFSGGLGIALLIMGMDIDLQQVLEVIK